MLVIGHMTKQMKHGCWWNIQICCPSVEMSSLGLRPRDDMLTSGQHIMFHLQPCITCTMYRPMRPTWYALAQSMRQWVKPSLAKAKV